MYRAKMGGLMKFKHLLPSAAENRNYADCWCDASAAAPDLVFKCQYTVTTDSVLLTTATEATNREANEALYGTLRFTTAPTRAFNLTLS
jgi:hypothetical protein